MADQYTVTARRATNDSITVDNGNSEITVGPAGQQPTELLLAGLGSCILSMVVDYALRNEIDADGVSVTVTGYMKSRPRRMADIKTELHFPDGLSSTQVDALLRAGSHCTIHTTLNNPPEITMKLAQ